MWSLTMQHYRGQYLASVTHSWVVDGRWGTYSHERIIVEGSDLPAGSAREVAAELLRLVAERLASG